MIGRAHPQDHRRAPARHDPADQGLPYPEYPTCEDKSADLAEHVLEWLTDEQKRAESVARLTRLRESVVRTGASIVFRIMTGLLLMAMMLAVLRNRFGPHPGKRSTDA